MLTMIIVHFIEYISKHVYEHAQKPTSTYVFTNQISNINIHPCTDISLNSPSTLNTFILCMLSDKLFLFFKSRERKWENIKWITPS